MAGDSDPRIPDGTYTTEELTAEDAVAALRARGVEIDEQMAEAIDSEFGDHTYTNGTTASLTVRCSPRIRLLHTYHIGKPVFRHNDKQSDSNAPLTMAFGGADGI